MLPPARNLPISHSALAQHLKTSHLDAIVQSVSENFSNALPISGGYAHYRFAIDCILSYHPFTVKPISRPDF